MNSEISFSSEEVNVLKRNFDSKYYLLIYTDVQKSGMDPFVHYMRYGWKEGRNPNSWFVNDYYLNTNQDLSGKKLHPFLHYLLYGKKEGRKPNANYTLPSQKETEDLNKYREIIKDDFDSKYYLNEYDDIRINKLDPLEHYLIAGWKEGRNPNSWFETKYYLSKNPDVKTNSLRPFIHYKLFGKKEGRKPNPNAVQELELNKKILVGNKTLNYMINYSPKSKSSSKNTFNEKNLSLHWVIPDFAKGAGGHMTIFRMIQYLERFGHKNTIWILDPGIHVSADLAYKDILLYFKTIFSDVKFVPKDGFIKSKGDAIIATGWQTAFVVDRAEGFTEQFYFVQDYEPAFYPTGAESLAATETYKLDFGCLCASPWLAKKMTEDYGRWATSFYLSYENNEYYPNANVTFENKDEYKIAVYARDSTSRRAVGLVMSSLCALAKKESINFSVDFYGQENLPFLHAPFKARNHGILNSEQLCKLYQNSDIGICFSATNYSLVPQEMMGCMLPLVELDTESTRAIFPEDVVTFSGPHPLDIAEKVEKLLLDKNKRKDQATKAHKWVKQFSWEDSAKCIESGIKTYLKDIKGHSAEVNKLKKNSITVDIIIPTFNGIGEIEPVIKSIRNQKHNFKVQIICVDSSSSDGTNDWLKNQEDILLHTIDQKEFQHGKTRNLAISLGTSKYIVVLTQDAQPANDRWLYNFINSMEKNPDVAGAFGRHKAYKDHSALTKHELEEHFDNFKQNRWIVNKDTFTERYKNKDRAWMQYLHFYSDNNSCMRRSIWEKIPYPEIDYGEDQVWAMRIIDAGYSKMYIDSAIVYHSHDYSPEGMFKRAKTEAKFFYEEFGYRLWDSNKKPKDVYENLNIALDKKNRKIGLRNKELNLQKELNKQKILGYYSFGYTVKL